MSNWNGLPILLPRMFIQHWAVKVTVPKIWTKTLHRLSFFYSSVLGNKSDHSLWFKTKLMGIIIFLEYLAKTIWH